MMSNGAQNFYILAINLNALHNYYHDLTQLFLDLYPAKILAILVKSFFLCICSRKNCMIRFLLESL